MYLQGDPASNQRSTALAFYLKTSPVQAWPMYLQPICSVWTYPLACIHCRYMWHVDRPAEPLQIQIWKGITCWFCWLAPHQNIFLTQGRKSQLPQSYTVEDRGQWGFAHPVGMWVQRRTCSAVWSDFSLDRMTGSNEIYSDFRPPRYAPIPMGWYLYGPCKPMQAHLSVCLSNLIYII